MQLVADRAGSQIGEGGKVVLVPLPPAVGRAIDWSVGECDHGLILLNRPGVRMDRNCATSQPLGVPLNVWPDLCNGSNTKIGDGSLAGMVVDVIPAFLPKPVRAAVRATWAAAEWPLAAGVR